MLASLRHGTAACGSGRLGGLFGAECYGRLLCCARTCRSSTSAKNDYTPTFQLFDRFKDVGEFENAEDEAAARAKRIAAEKIKGLVDEVLFLSITEAAQLSELLKDKLPPGDDSPIPGRMPFPHPMNMFTGDVPPPPGMLPLGAMPMMPAMVPMSAGAATAPGAAPAAAAPPEEKGDAVAEPAQGKVKEKKKETYNVKIMGFEAAKKISVIKEVRAAAQLGLKEAKDFVEQLPKVLQKGMPAADAEALRDKLAGVGAEVVLE